VLSFNGNKLITTSGGGMLVTKDAAMATRIRKWSTQSREDTPWYEHTEIGYNYRMSNVLAALGHSQLKRVDSEVTSRRRIRDAYRERLVGIEGVFIQSDPPWGRSNAWLTIIQLNRSFHPDASRHLRDALAAEEIESRPIWKPMHQQPVFRENEAFLAGRADALFEEGLCLPSGTALTEKDIDRVCSVIIKTLTA
jgi:dTDP-4-amino-4,6-dideoxygalactose transaminase